jgi:hypothetical protein
MKPRLCFVLFLGSLPLHVSVVRPSSSGNYHDWHEVQGFPSNATLFSIVVYYFIRIMRYMFLSFDHLEVEIYTSEIIVTGMRFRASRLTQLCFNSCLLFYSNYALHVSVVRPSSSGIIYVGN